MTLQLTTQTTKMYLFSGPHKQQGYICLVGHTNNKYVYVQLAAQTTKMYMFSWPHKQQRCICLVGHTNNKYVYVQLATQTTKMYMFSWPHKQQRCICLVSHTNNKDVQLEVGGDTDDSLFASISVNINYIQNNNMLITFLPHVMSSCVSLEMILDIIKFFVRIT